MSQENNFIRSMVRSAYDIQKVRIMLGNRITGNFKAKLGLTSDGMSESELDKQGKKVLAQLRESYTRITDGIVAEGEEAITGKLPTAKRFKGDALISTYTELVLVDQYMTLLRDEESHFRKMKTVLSGIPIYDEFLEKVAGIGPAMAGIIISEIDITRSEYPSSLWKFAGLDAITIGTYTDDKGVEHQIRAEDIDVMVNATEGHVELLLAEGKYPIKLSGVGRSRKDVSLVKREYINKNGEKAIRDSITYNPFLKTKLIGVLGTSFLRAGKVLVEGKSMGSPKRKELAVSLGMDLKAYEKNELDSAVMKFLADKGYEVVVERSEYGAIYYNYKNRLEQSPDHKEKTDLHRHNMAIRYMVKRFLVSLYSVWRKLEGLPVAEEYSVAKLHITHSKASESKNELCRKNSLN